MGILVKYSGVKAIHTSGVDVGPDFIHLDLDGEPVELPDALAEALCAEQPEAFKKIVSKKAADKAEDFTEKGDK
jgi:hypothetical protein